MISAELERSLHIAVAGAARAAERSGRQRWAALSARVEDRDCLAIFDAAADAERFYWERPDRGQSLVALGSVHVIETRGGDRFSEAADAARDIAAATHAAGDPGPGPAGALLVGGFAFADAPPEGVVWRGFPPGRLVLPALLFARDGDRSWCTAVRRIDPGADAEREARALLAEMRRRCDAPGGPLPASEGGAEAPAYRVTADRSHADYRARVVAALRAIGAGDLEKVVLARSVALTRNAPLAAGALQDELRRRYPGCTHFAVARGDGIFLGATPERLVRLRGTRVETAAVAGSAPRGRNPEDDARLGRELCESKKEQAEHASVVRALRSALESCCDDLDVPEAPSLLRLGEIQHLETAFRGTLRNGESILDLVGRLHPTPAVGGAPREPALAWIARSEGLDRGWYAGPVGFVDADGGGEFCVALRSALLRGDEARLFAGAGIVDGSRPEAELRETRLKLRALLSPLLEI